MNSIVSSTQVLQWALQRLLEARLLKDHGWKCTATVVWSVVLRAASRLISVLAACRDLSDAPSQQAVFDALTDGLPRTLKVLEKRLNWALLSAWPSRLQRRSWEVAGKTHFSLPNYWLALDYVKCTSLRFSSESLGNEYHGGEAWPQLPSASSVIYV